MEERPNPLLSLVTRAPGDFPAGPRPPSVLGSLPGHHQQPRAGHHREPGDAPALLPLRGHRDVSRVAAAPWPSRGVPNLRSRPRCPRGSAGCPAAPRRGACTSCGSRTAGRSSSWRSSPGSWTASWGHGDNAVTHGARARSTPAPGGRCHTGGDGRVTCQRLGPVGAPAPTIPKGFGVSGEEGWGSQGGAASRSEGTRPRPHRSCHRQRSRPCQGRWAPNHSRGQASMAGTRGSMAGPVPAQAGLRAAAGAAGQCP